MQIESSTFRNHSVHTVSLSKIEKATNAKEYLNATYYSPESAKKIICFQPNSKYKTKQQQQQPLY